MAKVSSLDKFAKFGPFSFLPIIGRNEKGLLANTAYDLVGKEIENMTDLEKFSAYKSLGFGLDFDKYIEASIKYGVLSKELEPMRCWNCGERDFKEKNLETISGAVFSYDLFCVKCDRLLGSWCTGAWRGY